MFLTPAGKNKAPPEWPTGLLLTGDSLTRDR